MEDYRTATDFDLAANQKAERKLLITAVDVSAAGSESPEWQIVGAGVEDSSIEFRPDTETITDILGITETTVNKLEMTQSLDPMTVRGGSKLAFKLHDILARKANSELAMFKVLIVFGYIKDQSSQFYAELHSNCTITPQSLGGSANVDMPIEISFSNDKKLGTVNKLASDMTFTETASI